MARPFSLRTMPLIVACGNNWAANARGSCGTATCRCTSGSSIWRPRRRSIMGGVPGTQPSATDAAIARQSALTQVQGAQAPPAVDSRTIPSFASSGRTSAAYPGGNVSAETSRPGSSSAAATAPDNWLGGDGTHGYGPNGHERAKPPEILDSQRDAAAEGTADSPITWLFEPESFTPLAKLAHGTYYPIFTDHIGTPLLMQTRSGYDVWEADTGVWGELRQTRGVPTACPFRFPGQYEDEETGLYYNRFRYYDPDAGAYITQDPIGLLGGLALYGYVQDPTTWVDPLGLSGIGGCGDASGGGAKFIVGPNGTAVHRSQAEMVESIQGAGARRVGPTTNTTESGTIYQMDTPGGPMEVRVMEGRAGGGPFQDRRTVVTRPGTKEYVNPNGTRIEGAVPKAERKRIGHIHGQSP